jgi:hypothetical protein
MAEGGHCGVYATVTRIDTMQGLWVGDDQIWGLRLGSWDDFMVVHLLSRLLGGSLVEVEESDRGRDGRGGEKSPDGLDEISCELQRKLEKLRGR